MENKFSFTPECTFIILRRPLSFWERHYTVIDSYKTVKVQEGERPPFTPDGYFMIHSVFELKIEVAEYEINQLIEWRWDVK